MTSPETTDVRELFALADEVRKIRVDESRTERTRKVYDIIKPMLAIDIIDSTPPLSPDTTGRQEWNTRCRQMESQIVNFVGGIRKLAPELADSILTVLEITLANETQQVETGVLLSNSPTSTTNVESSPSLH